MNIVDGVGGVCLVFNSGDEHDGGAEPCRESQMTEGDEVRQQPCGYSTPSQSFQICRPTPCPQSVVCSAASVPTRHSTGADRFSSAVHPLSSALSSSLFGFIS